MTNKDAIEVIKNIDFYIRPFDNSKEAYDDSAKRIEALNMAIKALEQEPCDDCIRRKAVLDLIENYNSDGLGSVFYGYQEGVKFADAVNKLPPVNLQEPKTGHCKDCKYFEYDSVAKVNGIPIIVAHEICKRWGDGCKTKEDGYCFLFEPQESEGEA